MMNACQLYLGAFWRSSTSYFDDVVVGSDPTEWTLATEPVFPASMLNNTQPTGYPSGSGGTDAINRVIPLRIASLPEDPLPFTDRSVRDFGVNGNPVSVRLGKQPTEFSCEFTLPDFTSHNSEDYKRSWGDLQSIAERGVFIYVLHNYFMFKGYIADAPGLMYGKPVSGAQSITFAIELFYKAIVGTSNVVYRRHLY